MSDTLRRILGKNIKLKRESLGLSQEELGNKINYSGSAISAFENGDREPKLIAAFHIAKVLGCSIEDFKPN